MQRKTIRSSKWEKEIRSVADLFRFFDQQRRESFDRETHQQRGSGTADLSSGTRRSRDESRLSSSSPTLSASRRRRHFLSPAAPRLLFPIWLSSLSLSEQKPRIVVVHSSLSSVPFILARPWAARLCRGFYFRIQTRRLTTSVPFGGDSTAPRPRVFKLVKTNTKMRGGIGIVKVEYLSMRRPK